MRTLRLILLVSLCIFQNLQEICYGQDFGSSRTDKSVLGIETITNITGCVARVHMGSNETVAVQLDCCVTLVDTERNLIVLQDDSGAMAVQTAVAGLNLKPGQRVRVQGRAILPYSRAFPAYSDQSATHDFLGTFQMPSGRGNYYLSRMRGYLHPQVTGEYTFWTAADDASELWLSADAGPENKQKIAEVTPGSATRPAEWDKFPSQKSKPITLKAGEIYYVEALFFQSYGRDCFAVAWQGPGIKRSIINGNYLTPLIEAFPQAGDSPLPSQGLSMEAWTNFFGHDFNLIRSQDPYESIVQIDALKITPSGESGLPTPLQPGISGSLDAMPDMRWVQMEGEVNFAPDSKGPLQFELRRGNSVLGVHVLDWNGPALGRMVDAHVRVSGVLEHAFGPHGEVVDEVLWVPDDQQVALVEPQGSQPRLLNPVYIHDIEPGNPEMRWGRRVSVHGRIIQQNTNGISILQGDDSYSAFCSNDGTNWVPLGRPVEIGMSNSAMLGLAIISRHDTGQSTASFAQIQGLGTNWLQAGIGDPAQPGHFEMTNGALTVTGGGRKLGDRADQLFYLYQTGDNQAELSTHLTGLVFTNSRTQVGLMARESLSPRAPFASVLFSPVTGPAFQYRSSYGDSVTGFESKQEYVRFQWLKLVRRKSLIEVQIGPNPGFDTNVAVNLTGTITWQGSKPLLAETVFESTRGDTPMPPPAVNAPSQSIASFVMRTLHPPETYMSTRMVSPALHGVVTYSGETQGTNVTFIQSGTDGGVQISWSDASTRPDLKVGQLLEVTGYAPVRRFPVVLEPSDLKAEGWSTLPRPEQYASTLTEQESAQALWVEATGVVRSENTNGEWTLMTADGPLSVLAGQPGGGKFSDSLLRVRGVLSLDASHNARLLVPSTRFIEVLESAPPDPFLMPGFPIARLMALNEKPEHLRKMKLGGVATCCLPEGLYVQDETGGAFVRTSEAGGIQPGDRVEVVGFPENNSGALIFTEAQVRKTGNDVLPAPLHISPEEDLRQKKMAGTLVVLDGTLLEQRDRPEGQLLTLQAGTKVVEAVLLAGAIGQLPAVPLGSRVSVSGVLQVESSASTSRLPGAGTANPTFPFTLWLRTPADLVILQRPPWWTLKRVALAGGLIACGLLLALVRVRILRRRVAQRTSELNAAMKQLETETRTAAMLAERDRLAGEIHDSLEQGLTAIMLQLDVASKHNEQSPEAQKFVRMARNMAEYSRAEVQHAVWDIQSPLLANADLGTALKHVTSSINSGSPELKVEIVGQPHPMPPSVEHHLLRIAQEAITNAIKHARARSVHVVLDYAGVGFKMQIADDGVGFIPGEMKPHTQNGNFGLQGMRARAKKIEAQLEIASEKEKGTTIMVEMGQHRERASEKDPSL